MKPLDKAFVTVAVVEPSSRRRRLVRAPNEFVRIVPYAFSWMHMLLYFVLVVLSLGSLLAISVWFPQVFTRLARQRLPHSSLGRAHYVLVLVHSDGFRSLWVEVKVQHPPKPRAPSLWSRFVRLLRRGASGAGEAELDKVAAAKYGAPAQPWVWFEFKKHRYAFDADKGEFERFLATANEDVGDALARATTGLDDVDSRTELFGQNVVGIDEPSVALLVFTKVMHPFYLFQVFSVAVWFVQDYVVYAGVILGMSVISLLWETYCEVSNTRRLRQLVHSDHSVTVVRGGGKPAPVHERELVPGDIVVVRAGAVCADMLLLSGACEADEASITGEALPVAKTPATGHGLTSDARFKSSLLFTGSRVTRVTRAQDKFSSITTEGGDGPSVAGTGGEELSCLAVVVNTGFATGKGELFRSILYPRQLTFEFERDSYRYLLVLVAVAIAAFVKRLVDAADLAVSFGDTVVHSLDLVTIAVPPALPLVLSSGLNFALARLRQRGVACMDARRINLAGQLTCFCFDKTGTLTGEHFAFAGADGAAAERGGLFPLDDPAAFLASELRQAMATCHELSPDGSGLLLDQELFAAARCRLARGSDGALLRVLGAEGEDGDGDDAFPGFDVLQRLPFDAGVQRATVLVRNLRTGDHLVVCKGSPEAVREVARACPPDLDDAVRRHAEEGRYCIAFAARFVPAGFALDADARADAERELGFAGLAYLTNAPKPESKGVVAELHGAGLDVRMITGDSAHTALHVGRALALRLKPRVAVVDVSARHNDVRLWDASPAAARSPGAPEWEHFTGANISRLLNAFDVALTGAALDKLRAECAAETLAHVVRHTRVFARVRPQQKAWIVEQLMDMGHVVGMCGDGTNDCGALKAAHVGLALLSGVEASLVAPFTSTRKSVADVPLLVREGRCAITTSFLAFKFMVLYPLIQLAMAATLAHLDLALSNNQYVWDDLAIVLGLSLAMLSTGAAPALSPQRPPRTLFSPPVACSIAGQVALFIAFFAGHLALLHRYSDSWFCRVRDGLAFLRGDRAVPASCAVFLEHNAPDDPYAFETTSVWLFGHLLYVSVAAAFNVRDPFRLPCYRNWRFTALLLAVAGVNLWFLLDTSGVVDSTFQLLPLPFAFRWRLLLLFLGHLGAAVLWELFATRVLPRFERPEWVRRLAATCSLG